METNTFEAPFQLLTSRIAQFRMANGFIELSDSLDLKRSVEVDYSIEHMKLCEDMWQGALKLTVFVSLEEKETDGDKFISRIEIMGYFAGDPALEENTFKSMLKINGTSALYSIMRGFLISVSAQSLKQGQVTLPMINFVDLAKQKEMEEQEEN